MYVQGIQTTNNINLYYRKNTSSITFCQTSCQVTKPQYIELVNKYLKAFSVEAEHYKKEGNSILQPSVIPLAILQNIAQNEIGKMQKFPAEHKLLIVTGRIGGGKTTFVRQNNLEELFYAPDADEIKPQLPQYNERGAGYVHDASWTINITNLNEALKRGINTIVQTATTIDNLDNIIDEARDHKYNDIVLIHIDTDEDIAIKRALERGKTTGRTVDPNVIKERTYIDKIVQAFENPNRGLSQIFVYNNNGNSPVQVKNINLNSWPQILTYVTESDD